MKAVVDLMRDGSSAAKGSCDFNGGELPGLDGGHQVDRVSRDDRRVASRKEALDKGAGEMALLLGLFDFCGV